MNKHEIDIGNYFKGQLEEFSSAPPKELWNSIQSHSTLTRYNKIQKLKRAGLYTALSLSAAAMIVIAIIYFTNTTAQELPDNHTPIQEQPTTLPSTDTNTTLPNIPLTSTNHSPDIASSNHYPSSSIETNIATDNRSKSNTEKTESPIDPKNTVEEQVAPTVKEEVENMPLTILPWLGAVPTELRKMEIVKEKMGEFIIEEMPFPEYPTELPQPSEEKLPESKFFVPNGFTPNNDGINDQFMAYTADEITEFEMAIYDRTSRLLFRSRDILNGWDGKVNRQPAPIGAYLYIITYKDKAGERHIVKGTVVLYQ